MAFAVVSHRELLQLRLELDDIRRHLDIGKHPLVPLYRNFNHGSELFQTTIVLGQARRQGERRRVPLSLCRALNVGFGREYQGVGKNEPAISKIRKLENDALA